MKRLLLAAAILLSAFTVTAAPAVLDPTKFNTEAKQLPQGLLDACSKDVPELSKKYVVFEAKDKGLMAYDLAEFLCPHFVIFDENWFMIGQPDMSEFKVGFKDDNEAVLAIEFKSIGSDGYQVTEVRGYIDSRKLNNNQVRLHNQLVIVRDVMVEMITEGLGE